MPLLEMTVSSFFHKGKRKCLDIMKSDPLYINSFKTLGVNWEIDAEMLNILEYYVCSLYGRKHESTVNEARFKIFKDTYEICPVFYHVRNNLNYIAHVHVLLLHYGGDQLQIRLMLRLLYGVDRMVI